MSQCPNCQASLDDKALRLNRCPTCGRALVQTGGEQPPASAADSGKTVPELRFAQTIDSISVPPAEALNPSAGTVADVHAGSAEAGDAADAVSRQAATPKADDPLRTVDELPAKATVEFSSPPSGTPQSGQIASGRTHVDQTIDSIDLPPAKPKKPGTLADREIAHTLDSVDMPAERRKKPSTVAGREIAQTLDSVDVPAAKPKEPGTVADRRIEATLDAVEMPPVAAKKPSTHPEWQIAVTGNLPGEFADRIQRTWDGTIHAGAAANTSLKADLEADEPAAESTLVIQPRAFRESKQSGVVQMADYDLMELLGEGGMGMVFAARQASINRTVAVKMLKPHTARDRTQRNKFLAEAVVTGDLEHPNIVPIYDLGANSDGALFYAMKRVQGTPWGDIIGAKSLHENLEILLRVADAVAFAHARGVIHRDLKPENVMLGEFGEVLVMDWGLAVPTDLRPIAGIKPVISMGGTPAYMAPEMAAGPFDSIGPHSDIYLLGAILYEIITRNPPHTAKDVMKCLVAAARNEIRPTDKSGELVDIALKAMATAPADRYHSVTDFRDAIRQYLSHSESVVLSTHAEDDLIEARESNDYQDYARAMFGFQQAYELWEGNARAKAGLADAQLAYATSAKRKGDFDLAASLLDDANPAHEALSRDVSSAQRERDARHQRLQVAKRVVIGLAATVFIVITGALFFVIRAEAQAKRDRDAAVAAKEKEVDAKQAALAAEQQAKRDRDAAVAARQQEEVARQAAVAAEQQAKKDRDAAVAARQKEEVATKVAVAAEIQAKKDRDTALLAKKQAEDAKAKEELAKQAALAAEQQAKKDRDAALLAKKQAEDAKAKEELAKQAALAAEQQARKDRDAAVAAKEKEEAAKRAAKYEAYVALIGAAANDTVQQAFDSARARLAQCVPQPGDSDFRQWEFGRLEFLAHRSARDYNVMARIDSIALAPDQQHFVTGDQQGFARIWAIDGGEPATIDLNGAYVNALAYSPDGRSIATATNDRSASVKIWDAVTRDLVAVLPGAGGGGHRDAVVSVQFSSNGQQLLTGSRDNTARLWDWRSGKSQRVFEAHRGPVWAARFSPDEKQIVTAGDDGKAYLWSTDAQSNIRTSKEFHGHDERPIYSAAFGPDGSIATGGADGRVLVWRAEDIAAFDVPAAQAEVLDGVPEVESTQSSYLALEGHTAAVSSVNFTRDEQGRRLVVSASHDNTLKVWDVARGTLVKTLRGHGEQVRCSAVSRDGQWVLSGSFDQRAKLWNVPQYAETRVLSGHSGSVLNVASASDGLRAATAGRDGTVVIWNLQTGQRERTLDEGHEFLASHAAFFPDGTQLATTAVDDTVRIWQVASGTQTMLIEHTGRSAALAVSHDGSRLLTGGGKASDAGGRTYWIAQLWNAATGQLVRELRDHEAPVSAVAFSPDDRLLLTGDNRGRGNLWDAQSGNLVRSLRWHTGKITAAVFSFDGARAVTSSEDGAVAVWDVGAGTVVSNLNHQFKSVLSLAVSPDGQSALTCTRDGAVRWWDLATGAPRKTLPTAGDKVSHVSLSPDGKVGLTVDSENAIVRLWDLETGTEVKFRSASNSSGAFLPRSAQRTLESATFAPDGTAVVAVGGNQAILWTLAADKPPPDRLQMRFSPNGEVNCAAFSHDGRRVVTASQDRTLRIWNSENGQDELKFAGLHNGPVNSAVFSRDGRQVLSASDDGTAKLWDAANGEIRTVFRGHAGAVRWAAFSPDEQFVVTASSDGTARIWKVASGALLHELKGHQRDVFSAAFSPDGNWVVTGSADNTAIVWDAATGAALHTLTGHTAAVNSVAFSPVFAGGVLRVITGSDDYTAKLWDPATGKELLTLSGHSQAVTSVNFTAAGRQVLTSSHDGTAIVWPAAAWHQADVAVRGK